VQAELAAVGAKGDAELRADVNAYRFHVHASPRTCRPLVAYAHSGSSPRSQELARALYAVLHAAQHAVFGVEDETEASCEALRRLPEAARRLGAPPGEAEELAAQARAGARCPSL
jgi:hypothetical protein